MIQRNKLRMKGWGAARLLFVLSLLLVGFGSTARADETTVALTANDSNYYEISTAAQLEWFAEQVNGGEANINGVMTADIDLSTLDATSWTPIGKSSCRFKGKFNGQEHTISGLTIRATSFQGLFGYAEGATIENVNIDKPNYSTVNPESAPGDIGAVCGEAYGTVIRNCHVTMAAFNFADFPSAKKVAGLGGIVGEATAGSKIQNCSVSGYITSAGDYVGGIVGVLTLSEMNGCSVANHSAGTTKISGGKNVGGIAGVCNLRTTAVAMTDCTVAEGVVVSGTDDATTGNIRGAEGVDSETVYEYDGYYEIYNASQLAVFSSKVNGGEMNINGRLMNDIDMTNAEAFTPIGSEDNKFAGVFDGQGYTISNLTIKSQNYAGLFGYIYGSARVKNINLEAAKLSIADNNSYSGLLVGMANHYCEITNCHATKGEVSGNGNGGEPCYVGGLVGKADESAVIDLCSFQGTVKDVEDEVGGIVGELNSGAKITNCYLNGKSSIVGNDYVGGIVGEIIDDKTTWTDCFVDKTDGTVTVKASTGNTSSLIVGKDMNYAQYTEDGLIYKKTGTTDDGAEEMAVIGVADNTLELHHVINDIGNVYDYATSSVVSLPGVKQLDFQSSLSGRNACKWINVKIADGAFDKDFETLYMRYTVYPGTGFVVMLRPDDVYPAGSDMFANCPDAKVYVDAEYYDEFCNDANWKQYKDHLVATTDMRKTEDTKNGVNYAYDRNRDAAASVMTARIPKGYDGPVAASGDESGAIKEFVTTRPVVDAGEEESNYKQVYHVIGCDNDEISENDGILKIYRNTSVNKRTTKVWASSFKGNTAIKKVQFISDGIFDIELGDNAFANCTNLESFDVVSVNKGGDRYTVIHPKYIPLGKDVFTGCTNLKIRIPASVYNEFLADTCWNKYKDKFVKTEFDVNSFTEKGVKYAYFVSDGGNTQYTNKNQTEMEAVVTPWMSEFRNFKTSSVLVPDNSNTIYYLKASGVDDSAIDDLGGELRIYNDIGTYYNYKTIALSSTAFQGNEHIKSIVFEDCASNISNANTQLSLVIPSETFKGCKNLKELSMYYLVTEGTNHYDAIKPTDIFIGKNVFDGVDEDFRIKVLPEYYNDYINDANWSQYKNYIVASDYVPTTEDPIVKDGITYDYAARSLNTKPTSETVKMQASLWNIPIIAAEIYQVSSLIQSIATTISSCNQVKMAQDLLAQKKNELAFFTKKTVEGAPTFYDEFYLDLPYKIYFAEPQDYANVNLIIENLKKGIKDKLDQIFYSYYDNGWYLVENLNSEGTFTCEGISAMIDYMNVYLELTDYLTYATQEVAITNLALIGDLPQLGASAFNTAASYAVSRALKNFAKNPSWTINGANWVETKTRTNVPHMYVKSVADDVTTATIYADPGYLSGETTYRYRTVNIGSDAFRNKKNLKKVQFQDREDRKLSYDPLVLALPDSCFAGCENLDTLDLVIRSFCRPGWTTYNKRYKSLTPDNFLPVGHDIFAGVDTTKVKILVGKDVIQDFKEDEYWGKYSSMFVAKDVKDEVDFTAWGANYSLTYDTNTIPLETEVESHDIDHVDIVSADDESLKDDNGRLYLINDYGIFNNYKLDNIKAKAFAKNTNLKSIEITDKYSVASDVYTDFNILINDSAFADCKNLRDVNLLYPKTNDDYELVKLSPSEITLGNGVFDGCDSLRIKFDINLEPQFNFYDSWSRYKDKFAPCFFEPQDSKVLQLLNAYKYIPSTSAIDYAYIDATLATPAKLKTLFAGTDIESFDEFRAFGTCGLDTIYSGMFSGCKNLQSISLPDCTKTIESEAFKGDEQLAKLTIPENVDSIGANAFNGSHITSFIVRNTVPAKGDIASAFAGLPDDYIIYVADDVVDEYKKQWAAVADHINAVGSYQSLKVVNVKTPGTLATELGLVYDYDNQTLTGNYAQYDSLRIIGDIDGRDIGVLRYMGGRDVENCESTVGHLTYLDLYEANIKKGTWEYNRKGTNDYVQEDNHVDDYMFWNLHKLKTLILPKSATRICKDAVAGCTSLSSLVVGDNVTDIEEDIVEGNTRMSELIMLPRKKPTTDEDAWNTGSSSARFSQIITSQSAIADYSGEKAYYDKADTIACCYKDDAVLEAMTKHHVFSTTDFTRLANIDGMVSNSSAICKFNELMSTAVTALGANSLSGMSALEEVILPLCLKSISADAFKGCVSLKTIWAINSDCPTLATDAFSDLPADFVIMVAEGNEDTYRKAWPQYKDHIQGYRPTTRTIREVTVTEPNTLAEELGFSVVKEKYADGYIVKSISGDMSGITALKVNGPLGTEDIAVLRMLGGRDPFNGDRVYVTNMDYLDIYNTEIRKETDTLIYYGPNTAFSARIEADNTTPKMMFSECDNLETVILPRTATTIGGEGLYNMYSLKKVVVGDNTTYIDDDAFGEDDNLKTIAFLCNSKPTLHGDAFTDPFLPTEDVFKVENMYVRKELLNNYTGDSEFSDHANNINNVFAEDALFCAYGSKAVVTEDELASVGDISGWFKDFSKLKDLSTLSKSRITELSSTELENQTALQHIALPSTMNKIEDGAFSNCTSLAWLDISECDTLTATLAQLGINRGALVYVPESFGTQTADNVVYGASGALQCARYNLTASRDYDVPKAFTAKSVSFDRTFTKDGKYALTLPFTADVPDRAKAYKLYSDSEGKMTFKRVAKVEANKPYVLAADADNVQFDFDAPTVIEATTARTEQFTSSNYAMTGTLSTIANADAVGMNAITMSTAGVWNLLASDDATDIAPFTAYVQANNTSAATSGIVSELVDYVTVSLSETADNSSVISDNNGEYVNAALTRTLKTGGWNTFCVPFDTKIEGTPLDGASVLGLAGVNGNVYSFEKVDELKAGEPYLVKPTAEIANPTFTGVKMNNTLRTFTGDYDFLGTYNPMTIDATKTTYFLGSDGKLKLAKENSTMYGLRAYFKVSTTSGAKPILYIDDEEITAIDDIEIDPSLDVQTAIYNVDGMYMGIDLNLLPRGVYIVNGKKVVK